MGAWAHVVSAFVVACRTFLIGLPHLENVQQTGLACRTSGLGLRAKCLPLAPVQARWWLLVAETK